MLSFNQLERLAGILMDSYVRRYVTTLHSVWENSRFRRGVRNGVVGFRMPSEFYPLLARVAQRFEMSQSGAAAMLMEYALLDAVEVLGLDKSGAEHLFDSDDSEDDLGEEPDEG